MRLISARRWMMLAAVLAGTTFQLTNCRQEASTFALRSAFSSVFVPINQIIVLVFDLIAGLFPGGLGTNPLGLLGL